MGQGTCPCVPYDFEIEGETYTLESGLSQIEGDAKKLFQRMLDEDSLLNLTAQDKAELAIFFSIQLTRTRNYREQWKELPKLLEQKLRTMAAEGDDLEEVNHYFQVPDENEIKIQIAQMMIQAPKDYAIYFANKDWLLLKTDPKRPFIISDNPLTFQNMIDMDPFGNLGLAAKGIEIYFPLSPTRALAMWCPSVREMCNKAVGNLRYLPDFVRKLLASPKTLEIEKILVSMKTGKPLLYHFGHVTNFNSLQIENAERYVFSSTNDFSLAKDMINRYSSMKNGPRVKSN